MSPASPRVAPVPQDEFGDEIRAVLRKVMVSADRYLRALRLARFAQLSRPDDEAPEPRRRILAYHKAMFANPSITPQTARVADPPRLIGGPRECTSGSALEDGDPLRHHRRAVGGGLKRTSDGTWSSVESALLSAADQMLDWYYIDDVTWSRLTSTSTIDS